MALLWRGWGPTAGWSPEAHPTLSPLLHGRPEPGSHLRAPRGLLPAASVAPRPQVYLSHLPSSPAGPAMVPAVLPATSCLGNGRQTSAMEGRGPGKGLQLHPAPLGRLHSGGVGGLSLPTQASSCLPALLWGEGGYCWRWCQACPGGWCKWGRAGHMLRGAPLLSDWRGTPAFSPLTLAEAPPAPDPGPWAASPSHLTAPPPPPVPHPQGLDPAPRGSPHPTLMALASRNHTPWPHLDWGQEPRLRLAILHRVMPSRGAWGPAGLQFSNLHCHGWSGGHHIPSFTC